MWAAQCRGPRAVELDSRRDGGLNVGMKLQLARLGAHLGEWARRVDGRLWEAAALVTACLFFAFLVAVASPQKSAAFDEEYHLVVGVTYWRTGDYRLATEHPPLSSLLAALPLLTWDDVLLPLDDPSWEAADIFPFATRFLWEVNARSVEMVETARRPLMLLGVLLLLSVYGWARRLWGRGPALLALALTASDPNLIAHSRVIGSDVALTALAFLACWQLWRALVDGHGWAWLWFGLATGLAMVTKFNGALPGAVGLLAIFLVPRRGEGDSYVGRFVRLVGAGAIAVGVVWAFYRFDIGPLAIPGWPVWAIVPAPHYWWYVYDIFFVIVDLADTLYVYLLGEAALKGWWYYLPVAIFFKTPLPLLILGGAGAIWFAARGRVRREAALWLLPVALLGMGLTGLKSIGVRHALPALPFAVVVAVGIFTWQPIARRQQAATLAGVVLVLWCVVEAARFFPHQEAYFNQLAGPWQRWSTLLVDSNLDWGQDLPALREVMAARGIEQVNLAYFGNAAPEKYGIVYAPLPSFRRFVDGVELLAYNPYTPEPGWYAISATSLRLGTLLPGGVDLYRFFQTRTPDDRAGYSIYLYHVTYPDTMTVNRPVVEGVRVADLSPAQVGAEPGARSQVKWRRDNHVVIYPQGVGYAPSPFLHAVDADLGGVFALLGYEVVTVEPTRPGTQLALRLVWRKGARAMPQPAPTRGAPISAFVHLTAGAPHEVVALYDGWATALRGLEEGDVLVHDIAIDLPGDLAVGSYTVLAGLYSPQDWVRLPVRGRDALDDGAAVLLGTVAVEE